ncbi:uncharacterized protein LOC114308300 [Camellia sinensis]|uniref:uncharacterized protein LOC114308300 n=1 Tax=Camellia sinensis TaxID=4442 RepID=UPI001035DB39|nr:uncharacterized protein LOC114308300 [Camellia sinensis]
MLLVPCAPFVQGTVPSPAQPCCDNLRQLYNQQPGCLCLLLNDTALSSFPINTTLALQLPLLCNLQVDFSTCSGVPMPPSSPVSQGPSGTHPNSSIAGCMFFCDSLRTTVSLWSWFIYNPLACFLGISAAPMVTVAPRTNIMGFEFGRSDGTELKIKGQTVMLVAAIAFILLSPA